MKKVCLRTFMNIQRLFHLSSTYPVAAQPVTLSSFPAPVPGGYSALSAVLPLHRASQTALDLWCSVGYSHALGMFWVALRGFAGLAWAV